MDYDWGDSIIMGERVSSFTCIGCGFDYPESSRSEDDEGFCYDCRECEE